MGLIHYALPIAFLTFAGNSIAHSVQTAPPADLLAAPARTWAIDCVNNEILVIQHPDSYLRYRLHEVDDKGDRVRDEIETPEGTVGRIVMRDGRPLTPQEDAAERDRLNGLVSSSASFSRHMRGDQANKKLGVDLLRQMPDAMLWSYVAGQPQLPTHTADAPPLVVLDFSPNPKWSPPTIPSEALTGLKGRVWVDPATRRMVRFEGELFHAVNIGWGVLAHIYPGGKVLMEQTNAGGQRWIVEHIDEQLNVRALMVRNVKQRLLFDTSGFQSVPPMTYRQATDLLLATPLPAH